MSKQKKVVVVAVLIAVLLVAVLAGLALYKHYAPSREKADVSGLFKLEEDQVAILVDDKEQEERGLIRVGHIYVPVSVASSYMDKRIYVDETEGILSYVTEDGLVQASVDAVEYTIGKTKKETAMSILTKVEDTYYVALDFIKEYASCEYEMYENPNRLVVMQDRDKKFVTATVTEKSRLRKGPGKKYAYYAEIAEKDRFFVETDVKEENEYVAVRTTDGISGYLPKERITEKKEDKWTYEKSPASFTQKGLDTKVCLGWHQVTNESSAKILPTNIQESGSFNVLCPTWFALSDNKGGYTSLANTAYVTQAHSAGYQVWGLINDFGGKLKLSTILGTTSIRTKLVNSLVASAIQYDLDGLNIDFENVTTDSAAAYLEFLRELTIKAHANDLVISVDNYTPASHNAFYDLEEQGLVVDYVILMAYDEHYSGSKESGSVSSLGFVSDGVANMLKQVPAERVVVGLPFFTRLWKEVKTKNGVDVSSAGAYGMSGAESVLSANDAKKKWDDTTGQYYAQYKADGATYKIWLEDEVSLEKKMQTVMKNKVAGVAFWKLGLERSITWKIIDDALQKE